MSFGLLGIGGDAVSGVINSKKTADKTIKSSPPSTEINLPKNKSGNTTNIAPVTPSTEIRTDIKSNQNIDVRNETSLTSANEKNNIKKSSGKGKSIINVIYNNSDKISDKKVFDVTFDNDVNEFKTKSDYVLNIFNKQGNIAHNSQIGNVELSKSGAKSTILHGFGYNKLTAVKAIKNVIENGNIVEHIKQYKGDVDRYVIASKGFLNGKQAIIGVVVKSYPGKNISNKFYLHEAEVIEADPSIMTAPQLSVDTVDESASNSNIPQTESDVNNNFANDNTGYSESGINGDISNNLPHRVSGDNVKRYNDAVNNLINSAKSEGVSLQEIFSEIGKNGGVNAMDLTAEDVSTVSTAFKNAFGNNVSEEVQTNLDVLDEISDLQNSKQDDIITGERGEIGGIDTSREKIKNGQGYSKIQTEVQTEGIFKERAGNVDSGRKIDGTGKRRIETRNIETLTDYPDFQNIKKTIGDDIPDSLFNKLSDKYENDPRLDEGYDFSDVVVYDMLADENNELRERFSDSIDEYFNTDKSVKNDSTGKRLPDSVIEKTRESVVRNSHGQLIPMYHGTDKSYPVLLPGDVGIYFGSYSQASELTRSKNIENPVYIKAYLDVKNPLVIEEDSNGWNAAQIVSLLERNNIITHEQVREFFYHGISKETNKKLVELLKSKGYDGIKYTNQYEAGSGTSYIVFDDSQVIRASSNNEDAFSVPERDIANAKSDNMSNDVYGNKDVAGVDVESRWTTEKVNDTGNKGVNIADIVNSIREKFDIPIAVGKITNRRASGIYKVRTEAIRTRIANNLPTISHELGHHIDKKYNLSDLESVNELRKAVSNDFLKQYTAKEKNGEAVAEFVRIYLKNINDASKLCPDFYSDFIKTLSTEDLKAINEIAMSVNEYLSYDLSERYDNAIVSSQKKEKVPFREKWHEWYSNWVDAFHPQKQAVDYVEERTGKTLSGKNNAYTLATNSLNAHTVANFLVCEGFRDLNGNLVDAKSFVDSIGMVDSKNVKLLDKYLVLRHSLEWIAPQEKDVTVKRVFADDTLENVNEIKNQIAEIEDAHPEIKTAAENLYEYQNNILRHFVIPTGGMTEDTLATLNRKYPFYVPFYRAVGKKSGLAKGTFANQKTPISRAKGSGELIISPTESIIRNTEKMVKFALRNQVMRVWAKYADTVEGFGQYMEKVPPDMLPHTINITTQKELFDDLLQQVVQSDKDYFVVSDLFDEIFGDAVSDFTPIANANKKIVTVLKGGKPSYYQIHDEALYNSVAELSPQQTSGLLNIMNSIMQPMKLLITQNNPIFAITNAIRDYGTAYKLSDINNPATFATMYVKALGNIITNSENYKQYKAMGGGHSSELSANIDSIAKTLRQVAQKDMGKARQLVYSIFRHPVETIASINDVVESTPRFMEFMRTLENGGDLQEAIFNADDITTNFKRSGKGTTAKAVNKTIMFNNAAIQGVDKTIRTLTDKDSKKRMLHLLKFVSVAVIGGLIRHFWNKKVDKDGYENLSSYKKNNFYNYAIGDGKFISLPKERENAILDSFVERALERATGNEESFYNFGSYLGSQLLPPMFPDTLNPADALHSVMGSTVAGGLIDVGFNQDFRGLPIESDYEKYLPSNERYTESTTKLAHDLGQTKLARNFDMSPKKIDHLISSYTGILGQVNKALLPMNENHRDVSLGLKNKFVSDSNYSTDMLNKMYENTAKAEKTFDYDSTIENAVEYEQNAIITSYISSMNKAVKALPASEQRNGRAYLLKTLNQWKYDNTSSQTEMLKRFDGETITDDCIITSIPKSTLEWTNNKVKYFYQMTPQEYNEYVNDYLNMVDKYRTYQSKICSNNNDYALALSKTNTEVQEVLSKKYKIKYIDKAQKTSKY